MAFKFEKVNCERPSDNITRIARSSVPWSKALVKREEAAGDGRWPFVFYYYYLEQLAKKLKNELDTPAWNEVDALADNEPDDVIKGLIHLQDLYSKYDPSEVQKIKDTIEVLKPILAAK